MLLATYPLFFGVCMSIDKFDYAEPQCCSLKSGKNFYYPELAEKESIPIERIIEKLDSVFAVNDLSGAERLLTYWLKEAVNLQDKNGELSILNEFIGYYRKTNDAENSSVVISRVYTLIDELNLFDTIAGATILLNVATNLKAFGDPNGAINIYERVLKIYADNLEEYDVRFGGLYNNYALALAETGDLQGAETYFFKALDCANDIDKVVSYLNLSELYFAIDANDENVSMFLDLARDVLERESNTDGYYAFVCEKSAPAFEKLGRNEYADVLKARARSIYERN